MVWVNIIAHPKFLKLSMAHRGAWLTLMLYASSTEPDAWRFRNREHAALLLNQHGVPDPESSVSALIEAGLFNELAGGALEVHDHADWQRYPSDTPEARAERKRRSRARPGTSPEAGHDLVTGRRGRITTQEESIQEERNQEETTTKERFSSARSEQANLDPLTTPDASTATLKSVEALISSKWHIHLSEKQTRMIQEIADRQGEGSKGYARVLGLLTVTRHPDPIGFLKEEDRGVKEAGKRRADAQEAESARWRQLSRHGTPPSSPETFRTVDRDPDGS